jgi:hypothetical protein
MRNKAYSIYDEFDYCYEIQYPANRTTHPDSYSIKIKNYNKLTKDDKVLLVSNIVEFTKYVYWFQSLPCPTYSQQYMSWYVGKIATTTERLMLQAQRGLAKSLTSQILTLWLLIRNKEEKIAVLSATHKRAGDWTTFLLSMLRVLPIAKHLYPNTKQRSSAVSFDVNGCKPSDSPSVGAYSITGQKTGMRATFLIYDDVEIPENSDTITSREKLSKGVREATNLGIANVYRSLALCTPQSSETIYLEMIDRGYRRVVLPAEYPSDITTYSGDLAPFINNILSDNPELVGEPTDERHDRKHLARKKMETTKSEFKLQYMLDTALSDEEKYPLKLRDLIVMDLEPDKAPLKIVYSSDKQNALWEVKHKGFKGDSLFSPRYVSDGNVKEYEGIAMFIDPSGRGSDETAYCITAQLAGRIFLLDFGGIKGGYDIQSLEYLANVAKRFQVQLIQVESNFGDGSFAELLKPVVSRIYKKAYREKELKDERGVFIEDVRAFTQKEKRIIETIEPVLMQHRLIVNKSSLIKDAEKPNQEYRFTYQMTHLTMEANSLSHDDIIDVVEMGVSYWQQVLAKDEQEELNKYKEEQEDLEIQQFLEEMCEVSPSNNIMDNY